MEFSKYFLDDESVMALLQNYVEMITVKSHNFPPTVYYIK